MAAIVVIGGSAGGIEALRSIVRSLKPGLDVSLFAVIHLPPASHSVLPDLLTKAGPYPAVHPRDGEPITPGLIYVAPPNYHLLVEPGAVRVSLGPRENRHRPAIDPLFRSAARAYGSDVLGVVLSGSDGDGSLGVAEIKARGGSTAAQDPEEAAYTVMPLRAINRGNVDYVLPSADIGKLINNLAMSRSGETLEMNENPSAENALGLEETTRRQEVENSSPSAFSCPDCGGVLWQLGEGEFVRYRCRVGHGFTPDGLLNAQSDQLEHALWESLKALEERASLLRRMSQRLAGRPGMQTPATSYRQTAEEAERHAETIRRLLYENDLFSPPENGAATEARPDSEP